MTDGLGHLSLEDDDDEGLALDFEGDDVKLQLAQIEFCLVGRFLTDRVVNFVAMRNMIADIWKPVKGVVGIKDIGHQRYIFQFYHMVDLKRVVEGGPWSYDNYILLLHHMKDGEIPSQVPLVYVDFWVHIYDLPIGYISESIGKQIANFIGSFVDYDVDNNSAPWRDYMRVRVKIDVFDVGCESVPRQWGVDLRAPNRRNTGRSESKWLRDPSRGDVSREGLVNSSMVIVAEELKGGRKMEGGDSSGISGAGQLTCNKSASGLSGLLNAKSVYLKEVDPSSVVPIEDEVLEFNDDRKRRGESTSEVAQLSDAGLAHNKQMDVDSISGQLVYVSKGDVSFLEAGWIPRPAENHDSFSLELPRSGPYRGNSCFA
ncbi:hypothetical protein PTKIN_Ptkin03bG0090400 [Pterospermum kingtungense]